MNLILKRTISGREGTKRSFRLESQGVTVVAGAKKRTEQNLN